MQAVSYACPWKIHCLDQTLRTPSLPCPEPPHTQIFNAKHKPLDIIKGCKRGATFYTIFGMDKKFQLLNHGGPKDEYDGLSESIKRCGNGSSEAWRNQRATINKAGIDELRSWTSHFDVDPLLHQLRKITAEKSTVAMPEVDVV
uniref:Uncharacterized protein n=1 Tax=Ditylenchus dipsaci TaxID=166011 RepID=A0A915EFP2_9BILA